MRGISEASALKDISFYEQYIKRNKSPFMQYPDKKSFSSASNYKNEIYVNKDKIIF